MFLTKVWSAPLPQSTDWSTIEYSFPAIGAYHKSIRCIIILHNKSFLIVAHKYPITMFFYFRATFTFVKLQFFHNHLFLLSILSRKWMQPCFLFCLRQNSTNFLSLMPFCFFQQYPFISLSFQDCRLVAPPAR